MYEKIIYGSSGALSVFETGHERCRPNHDFAAAFDDRFLIHFIASGQGIFRCGSEEYKLGAGNAFLIGSRYGYYRADSVNPWEYMWINFTGDAALSFLNRVGLSESKPVYLSKNPAKITECFNDIFSLGENQSEFSAYSRIFALLGCMEETNAAGKTPEKSNDYVEKAVDFIHANYYRAVNVSDICAFVGIEYSYLFRLFKDQLNMSPGKYLGMYRLSRAAALLKSTDMTIGEISSAVGYSDAAVFSKAFSRFYKRPPAGFRAG